jgi:hypothetical protein
MVEVELLIVTAPETNDHDSDSFLNGAASALNAVIVAVGASGFAIATMSTTTSSATSAGHQTMSIDTSCNPGRPTGLQSGKLPQ